MARTFRRTIQSTAEVPSGPPLSRTQDKRGYVELIWKVGPKSYLRCYEHRLVTGFQRGHVHHVNHDKSDNRPINLEVLKAGAHIREHGYPGANRMDLSESEIRGLFESGLGAPTIAARLHVSTMPVQRIMRKLGLKRQVGRVKGMPQFQIKDMVSE